MRHPSDILHTQWWIFHIPGPGRSDSGLARFCPFRTAAHRPVPSNSAPEGPSFRSPSALPCRSGAVRCGPLLSAQLNCASVGLLIMAQWFHDTGATGASSVGCSEGILRLGHWHRALHHSLSWRGRSSISMEQQRRSCAINAVACGDLASSRRTWQTCESLVWES